MQNITILNFEPGILMNFYVNYMYSLNNYTIGTYTLLPPHIFQKY